MPEPTEEELLERLARGSQDPDDFRELAGLLVTTNRPAESLEVLQRALDLPLPGLDRARLCGEVGWAAYEAGRGHVHRASPLAREAISLLAAEPETAETLFLRGSARCLLAHCASWTDAPAGNQAAQLAVADLEHALRGAHGIDTEWIGWAHYDAARAYCVLLDGESARTHGRQFLDGDLSEHDRLSGLIVLGEACRLAGRLDEAEHAVDEGLRLAEALGGPRQLLHHTRGLILRAAGRPREACESFEQELAALQANPALRDDPEWLKDVHDNLGDLYYDAGDYEKAMSSFTRFLACLPEEDASHAAVLHVLGQCHVGRGEYVEARRCFRAVVASPSASDEYREAAEREELNCSARLAFAAGDYQTAAEQLGRLLQRCREDSRERRRALILLGHCYYSLDRCGEAFACYDEVRSSPRADSGERAEAEEWADWSDGQRRADADEYGEAVACYERLAARCPEGHASHCTVLAWLARCYEALGATTAAVECYQEVAGSPQATEAERDQARAGLARLS